jgi:hypothetical protein
VAGADSGRSHVDQLALPQALAVITSRTTSRPLSAAALHRDPLGVAPVRLGPRLPAASLCRARIRCAPSTPLEPPWSAHARHVHAHAHDCTHSSGRNRRRCCCSSPSPFPSGHVRDSGVCRALLNTGQPLLHADSTTTPPAVSFLFTATGHSETPSWISLAVCYLETPPQLVVLSARVPSTGKQHAALFTSALHPAVPRASSASIALALVAPSPAHEGRAAHCSHVSFGGEPSGRAAASNRGQLYSLVLLPHAQTGPQHSPIALSPSV